MHVSDFLGLVRPLKPAPFFIAISGKKRSWSYEQRKLVIKNEPLVVYEGMLAHLSGELDLHLYIKGNLMNYDTRRKNISIHK